MSSQHNSSSADPHRPVYHFSPDRWMNDPIPFFWNGTYHIFFQHNPGGAFWGDMHWGHAVSRDLVRWELLPIALAPTPGGLDHDGCWTGCVVAEAAAAAEDEKAGGGGGDETATFHAFYTGIPRLADPFRQVQCRATSSDLVHWEKQDGPPVIAEPPPGFGACFRDPQVWRGRDDDGGGDKRFWYLVVGSELPEGRGGAALLYRSEDLSRWEFRGPLFTGDPATGHDFECPDFFPLGEDPRHVLLTSRGQTWWHVGDYRNERFVREAVGTTDGGAFYAAKTLQDDSGRRILFGWITEKRPVEAQKAAGWSGVLSLPRVLTLPAGGALGIEPAPELSALRGAHRSAGPVALAADNQTRRLDLHPGAAAEIAVRIETAGAGTAAGRFGAVLEWPQQQQSAANGEATDSPSPRIALLYDRGAGRLADTPLALEPGEPLMLRIFVDHSVVEVFANGRACQTFRVYPDRPEELALGLLWCEDKGGGSSGSATRQQRASVDVWEIRVPEGAGR